MMFVIISFIHIHVYIYIYMCMILLFFGLLCFLVCCGVVRLGVFVRFAAVCVRLDVFVRFAVVFFGLLCLLGLLWCCSACCVL